MAEKELVKASVVNWLLKLIASRFWTRSLIVSFSC